jgi:uncharacterized membrane protein YphA (DoxX/SURF4 family)
MEPYTFFNTRKHVDAVNRPTSQPIYRMKSPLQWIYLAMRFALGIVFIWSGGAKLLEPQAFTVIIDAYGLVPSATVWPIAVCLALLELIAGVGLLFDVPWSLEVITALMLLFIGILLYGIRMGLDIDCGCFGPDDPEAEAFHSLWPALYRDMVMMAAIGFLFLRRHKEKTKESEKHETFLGIGIGNLFGFRNRQSGLGQK